MKYIRIKFGIFIFICIAGSQLLVVHGEENEPALINSFGADITGDGFQEYIKLQGRLLRQNSSFYQDIWLDITSAFQKQWSISLQNGYHPEIQLIDLDHNKTAELFYQVAKDEAMENSHYQLYSLENGKVDAMDLPEHQYLKGKFNDDFSITLTINPTDKPISIDISKRKTSYIDANIYNTDGKPIDSRRPIIKPISAMTPVVISESKGYGLKSTQNIYGIDEHDHLGTIETTWYFQNNKWVNIQSELLMK